MLLLSIKGRKLCIQQRFQGHEQSVQENPLVNLLAKNPRNSLNSTSIDIISCLLAFGHAPVINYNVEKWTPYPLKLDELF